MIHLRYFVAIAVAVAGFAGCQHRDYTACEDRIQADRVREPVKLRMAQDRAQAWPERYSFAAPAAPLVYENNHFEYTGGIQRRVRTGAWRGGREDAQDARIADAAGPAYTRIKGPVDRLEVAGGVTILDDVDVEQAEVPAPFDSRQSFERFQAERGRLVTNEFNRPSTAAPKGK